MKMCFFFFFNRDLTTPDKLVFLNLIKISYLKEYYFVTGKEFTIEIQFRKAEDYPIDLYYLMDFSSSMQKHKNNLSALGNKLAETMKNITSNFQLGFGSFVDKVTLPFTSTVPDQ